jgi:molecular chaperone Hsp33
MSSPGPWPHGRPSAWETAIIQHQVKDKSMSEYDQLHRFVFEGQGIRGELVRLGPSWQSISSHSTYPAAVAEQLGQALAATVLLSATIKFRGSLILQAQAQGPIRTLVAQATHNRAIRGLAHWQGEVAGHSLRDLYETGHLVLTIRNEDAEPYQGIVALEGDDLAAALQHYFVQSEQLATEIRLAADHRFAAGLLLQELPAENRSPAGFEHLARLAETVTGPELLHLPAEQLLYRLFHEERVRLFEPEPVTFRCSCSRNIIERVLMSLGRNECESLLAERGSIEVGCEFCGRQYRFDAVDIAALYGRNPSLRPSATRQ